MFFLLFIDQQELAWPAALNWFFAGMALLFLSWNRYAGIIAISAFSAFFIYPVVSDMFHLAQQRAVIDEIETWSEPIDLTGKTVLFITDALRDSSEDYDNNIVAGLVLSETPAGIYRTILSDAYSRLEQLHTGQIDLTQLPTNRVLIEDPNGWAAERRGRPPTTEEIAREIIRPWYDPESTELSNTLIDYVVVVGLTEESVKENLTARINAGTSSNANQFERVQYHTRIYAPENPESFELKTEALIFGILAMDRDQLRFPHNPFDSSWSRIAHMVRGPDLTTYQTFEIGRFLCPITGDGLFDNCITRQSLQDFINRQPENLKQELINESENRR